MNIHHLELFNYVAKHGGIAEAVRRMPYGIQQPAISIQLIQLEKTLGTTLFRRRPFELTRAGQELFAFAEPFFSGTAAIAARIRGENEARLRIGASQTVLRDYLPRVLSGVRKKVPDLRVVLREKYPTELLEAVAENEIDVAITVFDSRPPAGLRKAVLARLRPQLLLHPNMSGGDTVAVLERVAGREPLISLPPGEPVCRVFQQELKRRRIAWAPTIEVSALELVTAYVRENLGVGLSIAAPGLAAGVKSIVLKEFPVLTVAAVWQKLLSPVAERFVEALVRQAASLRLDD